MSKKYVTRVSEKTNTYTYFTFPAENFIGISLNTTQSIVSTTMRTETETIVTELRLINRSKYLTYCLLDCMLATVRPH